MTHPGSNGEHQLQKRFGTEQRAAAFYENQMLDYLNAAMRDYIARQEMVFVATADSRGECDCSIRAGLPGFVRVLNEKRLIYPEYRGNGILASLGNMSENPHIGMLFVDFFESTVGLHVNGKASVVENAELSGRPDLSEEAIHQIQAKEGHQPERWVMVEVEEAYIHCSKHVALLEKRDKKIEWGTDDVALKGGDYFHVKSSRSRETHVAQSPTGADTER